MFLNPKDLRRIRSAAALWGTPPSRLSPIPPPLFPAVCGFARKVSYFACFWLKLLKLNALRGTSPPHPQSHLRRRGGRGTAQKARALPPALAAECIFWAGRQGVSKKIYKDDKAVFTNLSGRPPPALVQVTEARRCFPAFSHGFRLSLGGASPC